MKLPALLLLGLSILASPAFSQTSAPSPANESKSGLTKFDLDFPGGTPGELVAAIQKAMGRPLNAIIPEQQAKRRLPPLKMNRVDVAQLFDALAHASLTREVAGVQGWDMQAGFYTTNSAKVSDETVWYFQVVGGAPNGWQEQLKICRVYPLTPYLDTGLTVDDITTAIRTAWKMLGESSVPQSLTFHQETKLLIAVADQRSLETIDAVLKALTRPMPPVLPNPASPSPAKVSDEKKSKS